MSHNVTVVITSYNRPDLLALTLTGLGLQTLVPDEVVITDDGSSVDIPAAIAPVVAELPFRVVYVTQADLGFRAARSRNNGAREARSPYLVYLDQDVVGTSDCLRIVVEARRPGTFQCGSVVRLTEEQTTQVNVQSLREGILDRLATPEQRQQMARVHRKNRHYQWLYRLQLRRDRGPKLLSGSFFGVSKEDYLAVNGFDEKYQGWGNEDDDLGRRLHRYGVRSIHISDAHQYPLHLHHPVNSGQVRANAEYYAKRCKEIRAGDYVCEYGINNPLGDDEPVVTVLKTSG